MASRKIVDLTKNTISELAPSPIGQYTVYDAELPYFGLKVYPINDDRYIKNKGVREYIVEYKPNEHRRLTSVIGRTVNISPEEARKRAPVVLNLLKDKYMADFRLRGGIITDTAKQEEKAAVEEVVEEVVEEDTEETRTKEQLLVLMRNIPALLDVMRDMRDYSLWFLEKMDELNLSNVKEKS